jgi:hypothetical protein
MIKYALQILGRLALRFNPIRSIVGYISDWSNGFTYGSYSLDDEAALAVSFANNPSRGGGNC